MFSQWASLLHIARAYLNHQNDLRLRKARRQIELRRAAAAKQQKDASSSSQEKTASAVESLEQALSSLSLTNEGARPTPAPGPVDQAEDDELNWLASFNGSLTTKQQQEEVRCAYSTMLLANLFTELMPNRLRGSRKMQVAASYL